MGRYVALLRGVNLGPRNKVSMAALRELVGSLGHTAVTTYIQSGNVLFTAGGHGDPAALAAELEQAIAGSLEVESRVVVLTRDQLAQVVRDNPYPDEPNPRAVHAIFLTGDPDPELTKAVAAAQQKARAKGSRDTAQLVGRTLYVHTPDGFGRSDLAAALVGRTKASSKAGTAGTARNWATVTKLLALCDSDG